MEVDKKKFYEENKLSGYPVSDTEITDFYDVIFIDPNKKVSDPMNMVCYHYYFKKNNMIMAYKYLEQISNRNNIHKINKLFEFKTYLDVIITDKINVYIKKQNRKINLKNLLTDTDESYSIAKILKTKIHSIDTLIAIFNLINGIETDTDKIPIYLLLFCYLITKKFTELEKYLKSASLDKISHVLLAILYENADLKDNAVEHYKILYEEYQLDTLSNIRNLLSPEDFQDYIKRITGSKRKFEEAVKKIEELETQLNYMPDGKKYKEAKEHFETLANAK